MECLKAAFAQEDSDEAEMGWYLVAEYLHGQRWNLFKS